MHNIVTSTQTTNQAIHLPNNVYLVLQQQEHFNAQKNSPLRYAAKKNQFSCATNLNDIFSQFKQSASRRNEQRPKKCFACTTWRDK